MTTSQKKSVTPRKSTTKTTTPAPKDLETELPLSEKDEVKKAEQETNKTAKKK